MSDVVPLEMTAPPYLEFVLDRGKRKTPSIIDLQHSSYFDRNGFLVVSERTLRTVWIPSLK